MATEASHTSSPRRIAIMVGAGFVPGINSVITGAVMAAEKLGWQVVGIFNGFDGVLHRDSYDDGLVIFSPRMIENLDPSAGSILGQSARVDPFHIRRVNEDNMVEEVDMSDDLLNTIHDEMINGVISVVGGQGLSILYKLHRKGLNSICIPRSIDNDIASTAVDRQLGMAYGAGAIQALEADKNGVMVAFVPPEIKFVPLVEAINKIRTVPADSEFLKIADSIGIYCGR